MTYSTTKSHISFIKIKFFLTFPANLWSMQLNNKKTTTKVSKTALFNILRVE